MNECSNLKTGRRSKIWMGQCNFPLSLKRICLWGEGESYLKLGREEFGKHVALPSTDKAGVHFYVMRVGIGQNLNKHMVIQ